MRRLNEIKILINPNSSYFYLLRKALKFNLKLNLIIYMQFNYKNKYFNYYERK